MTRIEEFEELRPLLFSIAYRILGSVGEAEDAVQQTWLRYCASPTRPASAKAFLSAIVTRISIDVLRSARVRREQYVGPWFPEPLLIDPYQDPQRSAELADSVSMAALLLLERLSALERAVFVLREVFGFGFPEVALAVERSEAACRQIALRARRHMEGSRPRFEADRTKREELASRFLSAFRGGDIDGLTELQVWHQLNNDGVRVARCTVERLMADMGLQGCRRGRVWVRTTVGDDRLERPADLVERQFRAPAPNRLWVADLTYVKTHTGWVYVAFIIDVFPSMIVGWQASRSLRSDLAIDALEMSVFSRRRAGADLSQLTHHSDRGVQYLSVRSQRLAENAIVASVGSKGDSYDNALAESFNGLYKWELIYRPWRGLDDVEFATLTYVDWFDNRRLHGEIEPGAGFTTSAASEAAYYRQPVPADTVSAHGRDPIARACYRTRGASLGGVLCGAS